MAGRKLKPWVENLIHALLGIFLAFIFYQALGFALSTDLPLVAVVSSSMHHVNAEITHYQWLEKNLGYNRTYINSWPIPNGFAVGDMPIVVGSKEFGVGEVIVYSVPGIKAPIIHRIVKINPDGSFQTKGDNNLDQLPYELSVKKEQIHGKVVFVIPYLGYFKVFVSKIFGV